MPVIVKLPSGNWRAQDRRKGRYVSGSFQRQRDAEEWALEAERSIDRGLTPRVVHVKDVKTFADIIDLYINDMEEAGKPIRGSKAAVLEALNFPRLVSHSGSPASQTHRIWE